VAQQRLDTLVTQQVARASLCPINRPAWAADKNFKELMTEKVKRKTNLVPLLTCVLVTFKSSPHLVTSLEICLNFRSPKRTKNTRHNIWMGHLS